MADKLEMVISEQVGDALRFYEFMESHGEEGQQQLLDSRCEQCGLTYPEFVKIGLVGCANCFLTFRPAILAALKILHTSEGAE